MEHNSSGLYYSLIVGDLIWMMMMSIWMIYNDENVQLTSPFGSPNSEAEEIKFISRNSAILCESNVGLIINLT